MGKRDNTLLNEKHLFDFYTKEKGKDNKPVHFERKEIGIKDAIEYAKEFDLNFQEVK